MLFKVAFVVVLVSVLIDSANTSCDRDRNVVFQDPFYLNFENGFFYIQGLTNGESVVIYKHPDDDRVFGQYSFKNTKCFYETIYYYISRGKYEFTNPFLAAENEFNITNKLGFERNGVSYDIEYNIKPQGFSVVSNLGDNFVKNILTEPVFRRGPHNQNTRELFPNLYSIERQNLKVSYLINGEHFVQHINNTQSFLSIEGSYSFKTSDKKYHSISYEIPLDFDYVAMIIKEYEISNEESFYRPGTLQIFANGTSQNVKYFVTSNGFHLSALQKLGGVRPDPVINSQQSQQNVNQPFSGQRPGQFNDQRQQQQRPDLFNEQRQQQRPGQFNDQKQQQRPDQFNDQRPQQRPDQRPAPFPEQRPQQQAQRQVRRPQSIPAESLLTRAIQTFARLF
ncbi:unnamed protein product [Diamesa hyperborea]